MPPIKQYARPKKGTIKRLFKSLWKNFKFELIISLVTLILSIFVNLCGSILCGSIFASLIADLLTQAIPAKNFGAVNLFTDVFDIALFGTFPLKASLSGLLIALICIYGIGVICSWTWNRTMAIVTQKYLNLFRIEMFSHMQNQIL